MPAWCVRRGSCCSVARRRPTPRCGRPRSAYRRAATRWRTPSPTCSCPRALSTACSIRRRTGSWLCSSRWLLREAGAQQRDGLGRDAPALRLLQHAYQLGERVGVLELGEPAHALAVRELAALVAARDQLAEEARRVAAAGGGARRLRRRRHRGGGRRR